MKKIPVLITIEGGIVQNVDSPQALDVLIMDFDDQAEERLICNRPNHYPEDWPEVTESAALAMEKENIDPNEYSDILKA